MRIHQKHFFLLLHFLISISKSLTSTSFINPSSTTHQPVKSTNNIIASSTAQVRAKGVEQKLIENLFKNYNKYLRPPGTVQVKFALNLNQIIYLLEKEQIIVLNAFIDHEWTDTRLSWGDTQIHLHFVLKINKTFNLRSRRLWKHNSYSS
jgi:hypothetical protein